MRVFAFVPVERSLRPRVGLFAPLRDKVTSSAQSLAYQLTEPNDELASSLDQLVGSREQRRRHFEPERLGRLEVDHQLIFRRSLHRKISWLLALEDAVDIAGGAPIRVDAICPVGNQAAAGDEVAEKVDRRQSVPSRE